jgi:Fe-coproporphyrin III synthase
VKNAPVGFNTANNVLSFFLREADTMRCCPRTATLELTHRCNLQCKMCRLPQQGHARAVDELDAAKVLSVVDELQRLGVREVWLVGAEPFLRRDLFEIVEGIVDRGLACSVTTNGTLLNDRMVNRLLASRLQFLTVSIDAPNVTHDFIRGKPIFGFITGALASLAKARQAKGQRHPWINIHCTVSTHNAADLSGMIPLCEQLGADSLSFQYVAETTPLEVKSSVFAGEVVASDRFIPEGASLHLHPGQQEGFRREIMALQNYRGPLQLSHRVVSALSHQAMSEGGLPVKKCYWIRSHVVVDPYGNVHPCANVDRYVYGNVKQETMESIWYGQKAMALRDRIKQRLLPVCRACCHFNRNWTPAQILRFLANGSV